jgi:hypothetical protein
MEVPGDRVVGQEGVVAEVVGHQAGEPEPTARIQ